MALAPKHSGPVQYDLYLGVIFVMADGEHRVICRVTKAALDDRAVMSGRRLSTVEMFEKFRSEIEAAIAILPPTIKEAAVFVHVERRSVDEFARKLGDRGYEKAQARLTQAYRSLSGRMKVPFPEAFEKAVL